MPPLSSPQLVTIGDPAMGWWLIDRAEIAGGPYGQAEDEWYLIAPTSEVAATMLRDAVDGEHVFGDEGADVRNVHAIKRLTSSFWIYRDVQGEELSAVDVEAFNDSAWFDRVGPADHPPELLRPRPARELPSLIGQRLRAPAADGGWCWVTAVSEPSPYQDDIVVRVASAHNLARLSSGRAVAPSDLPLIPMYLLWAY